MSKTSFSGFNRRLWYWSETGTVLSIAIVKVGPKWLSVCSGKRKDTIERATLKGKTGRQYYIAREVLMCTTPRKKDEL